MSNHKVVATVVPSINGKDLLRDSLRSLQEQTQPTKIIVVDNGSTDGTLEYVNKKFPNVDVIYQKKACGFARSVNLGIEQALSQQSKYIALLNNDAVADPEWLGNLIKRLESQPNIGIVTSRIMNTDGQTIDTVGESYSAWGLPYPSGREEKDVNKYVRPKEIFGASGGASIYRVEMLAEIGLFDEDFFAYYEDVDLSFRAQLAGWKVWYEPKAVVYHDTGSTSRKIKGFTTYHTLKNLPWVMWKNVPAILLPRMMPRFYLAYWSIFASAITRHQYAPAVKGIVLSAILLPKKLMQRHSIQKNKKINVDYIEGLLIYDLPPEATKLRKLRDIIKLRY